MRGRGGFTLIELVVAVGIAALLALVLLPQVLGRLNQAQTATLLQTLGNLDQALLSFRGDTGRYPRRLSYLSALPAGAARDVCGQTLPDVAKWRGPYVARAIGTGGLPVGTATVRDSVERTPASAPLSNPLGTLLLRVDGVDRAVAEQTEAAFDGNADFGAGSIRWVESGGSGTGTLTYAVPIRGC